MASVSRQIRALTNTRTLGRVAVRNGCQTAPLQSFVDGLALAVEFDLLDARRRQEFEQLSKASFPYNLVSSDAKTIDIKRAA